MGRVRALTAEDARYIREALLDRGKRNPNGSKVTPAHMARLFRVSVTTIHHVLEQRGAYAPCQKLSTGESKRHEQAK